MKGFYYVYILVSETDDELHYIGVTCDLNSRLAKHNEGRCAHTSQQSRSDQRLKPAVLNATLRPDQGVNLLVAIFEAFPSLALQREQRLRAGIQRNYLCSRLEPFAPKLRLAVRVCASVVIESVAVHALLVERDRLRCFRDQLVEAGIVSKVIPHGIQVQIAVVQTKRQLHQFA
jgi:GIY-YIG catalytic domain